ncbi:SpoIIE family protein phosphatase [Streptomyces sp. AK02-01A]|uniref:SpoIIE family protein phosphatase n=1 Tax=Streptomyces sp. AK02-01A TaxID=3028648 RepID=UPI0029BF18C0|nr:SpoIIE family protein phosphatase [Streptomyces sp. AK02-01A]MDX3853767.1 SpoIIE family protein phosphatase [Streptomyces sp. AK02-01A]
MVDNPERVFPDMRTDGAATAVVDEGGAVAGWTPAAERLTGYSAEEVMGRPAGALLFTAEHLLKALAAQECRTRGGWSGRAALRHRDGHRIDMCLRVSPLSGADGKTSWLVSVSGTPGVPPGAASGLESMLAGAPIGVIVRDLDLRCTWVNDVLEQQDGIPREERLGRRLTESLPGVAEAEAAEGIMWRVLHTGSPVIDFEFWAWLPVDRHRRRAFSVSFFRLEDADGQPLGVCAMWVDVTRRERARERLAILNDAGTRIGTTLDVMRTGQELADLAVPLLADFAAVDLTVSVPLGEEPPVRPGPTGGRVPVVCRAGVASVRPGAPEALWERGAEVFVPPASPFARVLSSGKSRLEPVMDISPGSWLGQDPARAEKIHESGMHSCMYVPIHARGRILGVAVFARTEDPVPFEEDDLLLAEELVNRAALSLDNANRYTRERATAFALQRNLLPQRLAGGTAVDVASHYMPADSRHGAGGDWFDVIPLSGARVALVVGDVVGHGINAAATMGRLRTAVHTLADMDLPPDELLAHLDDLAIRLIGEDVDDNGTATAFLGATCLYVVYDPVTRRCAMARAGHPPPAIIGPHGQVSFADLPAGTPLGLGLVPFEAVELELPEASTLALYTDGLVETRDQDIDTGMHRLGAVLAQPGLPLEDLCSTVVDSLPSPAPYDDVTLLLARTRALSPSQTVSWELPTDPAVVSTARSLTLRQLTQWGLQDLATTTELIVSELVTNAIRHATGPIGLRLIRHQLLTCEVHDTSNSVPRLRHARTTDEDGRGLFLVAQMSHRRGTRYTADGKTVWAEQELTPQPA